MYVYDTHVAFYSNLLFGSFVTKLVIPVRVGAGKVMAHTPRTPEGVRS